MTNSTRFHILLHIVMLVQITGCVSDQVKDHDVLTSYQQTLVHRGPQQRAGADGLDFLTPKPEITLPELEVTEDVNAGKKVINLTIEQAITRALANSPQIRAMSFEPDISKEDITKAAAEFDYTAFGNLNYTKDDKPNNSLGTISEGGIVKSYLYQAGIKQKGVTGLEWSAAWALTRSWDNWTTRRLSTRYEPMLVFQIKQPLLRDAWAELNLAGLNISKLNYRIVLVAFRQKTEDIAVEVISVYWALLQARREMQIQRRLLDKTQETLKKVEARKEIDATAVQIKQAEASMKARQATLIEAKKRITDVQDVLLLLLADPQLNVLSKSEIVPATAPSMTALKFEPLDALQLAMQNNPVIQQSRLEIEVADINIDIAKNQKLPSLNVIASAELQGFARDAGEAQDGIFNDDYTSYGIGLALEYPLGNRQRKAELRRRQLERAKAISELQSISDQVATRVKERIRKVDSTYQQAQAQADAVDAAKIQLQAIEDTEPIRAQLTPEFLLVKLQAQETLANAQRAQIQAIVDFNTALATLAQATGTVLQLHQVQTALPLVSKNTNTTDNKSKSAPVESDIQPVEK